MNIGQQEPKTSATEQVSDSQAEQTSSSGKYILYKEYVVVLIQATVLALLLRTLVFQSFTIPSESMVPTLLVGDYIMVSKTSYGYSRHSLPYSPDVFSGRVWASSPERGDVAVFKLPSDIRQDYVKRVIGLPGDRVRIIEDVVHINDVPVQRVLIPFCDLSHVIGKHPMARCYRETLDNGASYSTLDLRPRYKTTTQEFLVPDDHYFMLGDNRDNSLDSRSKVGMVPIDNFVGRAELVYFSSDSSVRFWEPVEFLSTLRYHRFFLPV